MKRVHEPDSDSSGSSADVIDQPESGEYEIKRIISILLFPPDSDAGEGVRSSHKPFHGRAPMAHVEFHASMNPDTGQLYPWHANLWFVDVATFSDDQELQDQVKLLQQSKKTCCTYPRRIHRNDEYVWGHPDNERNFDVSSDEGSDGEAKFRAKTAKAQRSKSARNDSEEAADNLNSFIDDDIDGDDANVEDSKKLANENNSSDGDQDSSSEEEGDSVSSSKPKKAILSSEEEEFALKFGESNGLSEADFKALKAEGELSDQQRKKQQQLQSEIDLLDSAARQALDQCLSDKVGDAPDAATAALFVIGHLLFATAKKQLAVSIARTTLVRTAPWPSLQFVICANQSFYCHPLGL